MDLIHTKVSGSLKRCYLNSLTTCSDELSGEHYVSKAILNQIGIEQCVDVSGVPWIAKGETRKIAIAGLVGKNLCRIHNSRLAILDSPAERFYEALRRCLIGGEPEQLRFLFSGHDIERWFLKTLVGLAASKNLSSDRERLHGAFDEGIDIVNLLHDPLAWKSPAGLYFTQRRGTEFNSKMRSPWLRLPRSITARLSDSWQCFKVLP